MESIKTLLSARKDLRIAIVCELYKKGEISIGKACELAGVDIDTMKNELQKRDIIRYSDATEIEMKTMMEKSLELINNYERK